MHQRHRQPGPLGDGGIVGHVVCRPLAAAAWAARISAKRKPCGVCARQSPARSSVAAMRLSAPGLLQRIGERNGRDGAGRVGERLEHPVDDIARDERPDGIVDQHPVGGVRLQRLEAVVDGSLPRRPAVDGREQPVAIQILRSAAPVAVGIACADHDLDHVDAGVLQEHARACGPAQSPRRSERTAWAAGRRPGCRGRRQRSVRRFSIARPFAPSMKLGLIAVREDQQLLSSPDLCRASHLRTACARCTLHKTRATRRNCLINEQLRKFCHAGAALTLPIRIGRHTLSSNVLLAPMSGVTDLPFRQRAHFLGAGLVTTEMVASEHLVHDRHGVRDRAVGRNLAPFVIQLAGCEARWMAEGARMAATIWAPTSSTSTWAARPAR